MTDTAFQIQYRQEFIAGFEQHQSLLRDCCTNESVIKGNQAVFLVADSGNASAVTRGVNGLIPARSDDNNQNTCTLAEWHDLVRKTGFNIFASQGNQRSIMQMTSMAVINRKVDLDIITALNTGTLNTGTAVAGTVQLFQKARVMLSNQFVPWDGNVTLLATPALVGYLEQAPEFSKATYVDVKPFAGEDSDWRDRIQAYRWRNCLIVEHPNLPGVGTNAAKCFLFHKNAIGHAIDTAGIQSPVGYFEEQDYSWARCTAFMGSKVLQNNGIIVINHDDTGLSS